MLAGERQVAPSVEGIRRDHVARYEWAARKLPKGSSIIDVACGVGYGSLILAQAGHRVLSIDRDAEAIAYAREHYPHPNITYRVGDASHLGHLAPHDAAVCFETIEHLEHPLLLLQALRAAPVLLASVPDEDGFPYRNYKFHFRHYTRGQFESLLSAAGFRVAEWHGQPDRESEVEPCRGPGRTIIVAAERRELGAKVIPLIAEPQKIAPVAATLEEFSSSRFANLPVPERVAILGLGPSLEAYIKHSTGCGSRHDFVDEVWGINAAIDVIQCDRGFHMDDVRIQELRAAARPQSNIAAMLPWLRKHPGPIYTSRPHPDYPGLIPYPLEDVINACDGFAYFNGTTAYAVAYARFIGVKKLYLFGCDFSYANSHRSEQGRACVEFHLGLAKAQGMVIGLPDTTSLMDGNATAEKPKLYGYDTVDIEMTTDGDGPVKVSFVHRDVIPTADEIEHRYDHSRHPNPLRRD